MQIELGQTVVVRAGFRRRGVPITMVQPPRWVLYNSDNVELLSGVASLGSNGWEAQITLSATYTPPSSGEVLTVQFTARDTAGNNYTVDKELTLNATSLEWLSDVVLYNKLIDEDLHDTLTVPRELSEWTGKFVDPAGVVLASVTKTNPVPDLVDAQGYTYALDLGQPVIQYAYPDPYQIIVRTTDVAGVVDSVAHVVYVLTARMTGLINSLRMYLDKARLQEIDPSLQWHMEELVHFVHEGIKEINAAPPTATFWTADNFPSTLQPYLQAAAALAALRSRHLAEGLTAFQFQGLNTSLDYNRADVLQAHIDAMQTKLEALPQAKRAAIQTFGQGTPAPGVTSHRISNLGATAVTRNLVNRSTRF